MGPSLQRPSTRTGFPVPTAADHRLPLLAEHDRHSDGMRALSRLWAVLGEPVRRGELPGKIDLCWGRSEGLVAAVEYLVVGRALVKVGEHRLCLFWHVGSLVVRAHECLD